MNATNIQRIMLLTLLLILTACSSDPASDTPTTGTTVAVVKQSCILNTVYLDETPPESYCVEAYPLDACEQASEENIDSFIVDSNCVDAGFSITWMEPILDGYTGKTYDVYFQEGLYETDPEDDKIDSEDDETDLSDLPMDEKSVTTEGGKITILDAILEFPYESISRGTSVKVIKSAEAEEGSRSDEYAMTDLLPLLQKSITLKLPLKNSENDDDSTELFIQYIPSKEGYSTTGGDSPYLHLFKATKENNYAVADLYNFITLDSNISREAFRVSLWDKLRGKVPKIDPKDFFSFLQTKAMHRSKTDDGIFEIYYPVNYASFEDPTLESIDLIEEALSKAALKLKTLGFEFKTLSQPIPVVLVKSKMMSAPTNKAEQTKPLNIVTNKYPMIKVNISELLSAKTSTKGKDEISATLGHEFFHCIQNLYDPAWTNNGASVCISEASSVWFEHSMSTHPTIYSFGDTIDLYASFLNYGLDDASLKQVSPVWTSRSISERQNLGYGMAGFLLYVTIAKQDKKIIYDMWSEYLQGKSFIKALDAAIKKHTSNNLSTMWRRFAMDYYTGFKAFAYKDYLQWPLTIYNQTFDVSKNLSFSKTFVMPPYSANAVYIGNKSSLKAYDLNISIKQENGSLLDSDAYVFDAKTSQQLSTIAFDGTPLSIKFAKKPTNARVIVLINSSDEKKSVTFKLSSKEEVAHQEGTFESKADFFRDPDGFDVDEFSIVNSGTWRIETGGSLSDDPLLQELGSRDRSSVMIWMDTEAFRTSHTIEGNFEITLRNNVEKGQSFETVNVGTCVTGKAYYKLGSGDNRWSSYTEYFNVVFDYSLDDNVLKGRYMFPTASSGGYLRVYLQVPCTCDRGDGEIKSYTIYGGEVYFRIQSP